MVNKISDNALANRIAMVVILLMAIGTVFVFSASANVGVPRPSWPWYHGLEARDTLVVQKLYSFPAARQILFFPLACAVLYTVSCFHYRRFNLSNGWLKSPVTYLLALSIVLLIVVLFPQVGIEVNRARRWLRIPLGPITVSFQPSELAKWAIVFFLAAVCDKLNFDIKSYWKRFVPICSIIAVVVALIIIEDFGTAAFVALLGFLMLIIAGARWRHIFTLLPFGVIAFLTALFLYPGRMQRLLAFWNPEKWADSVAYQANQSLIAIGSGGLWGKGLGQGICKYGHLPEDTTDFIFSIIGEELGFVGTALVIGLFIVFVWLGILVVVRCQNRFGQILAGGIVLTIAIQAALNIAVVTVVLPTKGIPLPFVSAGGTSMLLSSAAVGVLLNIAKHVGAESHDEAQQTPPKPTQLEDEPQTIPSA
jgi:cell division protein FtsW